MGNAKKFIANKAARETLKLRKKKIEKLNSSPGWISKDLFSIEETSSYIHKSIGTLAKMRLPKDAKSRTNDSFIPFLKSGKNILYKKSDLDFYIKNNYKYIENYKDK